MTTKKRMLYSRKELLDLKTKSLKRLQEGKLTKKQQVDIEELIKTIDEILEVMKEPTDKTGWKKAWEIITNIHKRYCQNMWIATLRFVILKPMPVVYGTCQI